MQGGALGRCEALSEVLRGCRAAVGLPPLAQRIRAVAIRLNRHHTPRHRRQRHACKAHSTRELHNSRLPH